MSPSAKNGVLVIAAVLCGLGLSAKPWMLAHTERTAVARTVRLAEIDEAAMVRDRETEGRLGTELGKEEILRAQGYRPAGELPLTR